MNYFAKVQFLVLITLTIFSLTISHSQFNDHRQILTTPSRDSIIRPSLNNRNSSEDPFGREAIYLPDFPDSITYETNIVFIGIDRKNVNTTILLDSLPKNSQISRYVPLAYWYEPYINYSFDYNIHFMHTNFAVAFANYVSDLGSFGFSTEMGIYWTPRTNVSTYKRINPDSCKTWISENINSYYTDTYQKLSLSQFDSTIFITNLFVNGSNYFTNQSCVPHTYYNEKTDHDTQQTSNIRTEGRHSPGFEWEDSNWLFLDLSSGPSTYETIRFEYTNFVEYFEGTINSDGVAQELLTLIRSAIFSRLTPTYLYEPIWKENTQICIIVYHDSDFTANNYIDSDMLEVSFGNLLSPSNVNLTINFVEISDGDSISEYLSVIESYTDYSTWASKLVDYVKFNEEPLFGSYDTITTNRYLCGVFATGLISGDKENPVERALGYTYANYGSNRAIGSVVTISPQTILDDHEGLTQTTIHEIGHAISLRHPHDFRFNGDLYEIWTWDLCSTPLSYMTSNYDFTFNDKVSLYRGNCRYLFNETFNNFNEIRNILESKEFPVGFYPSNVYQDMLSISFSFNRSLSFFDNYQYSTALSDVISAYILSLDVLNHCISYNNYFEPILNFNTINESIVDFGDNIIIDGKIVSYSLPNISIRKDNLTDYCDIDILSNDSYLYEVEFISILPSIIWGSPEGLVTITIDVFDGVIGYSFNLIFDFQIISISIVTPSKGMTLDLSQSDLFTIFGYYYSFSNTSIIQAIYGGYWYVNDHKGNENFWVDVNKDNNNEWSFFANSSSFVNGNNIIIVRITNGISTREDTINLKIHGLPESPSSNSTIYSEIFSNNTKTTTNLKPPPLDSIILVISSLIIILATYPTFKLTRYKLDKRALEKLSQKDYSESLKSTTHLKELSEKVDSKLEQRDKTIPKGSKKTDKEFIPKRRR